MIKDFNNCRLVEFGNGTVTMGIGSFDKRNVCLYVYESEYSPINGERVYNENSGKRLDDIDEYSNYYHYEVGRLSALREVESLVKDLLDE